MTDKVCFTMIDSNVLLGFYEINKEDLKKVGVLSNLIKYKKVINILPEIVENEWFRFKDAKIKNIIHNFEKIISGIQVPNAYKVIDDGSLVKMILDLKEKANDMTEKINSGVKKSTYMTDQLIQEIIEGSSLIATNNEIYESARKRFSCGNPPRKVNDDETKLGDPIIWESILNFFRSCDLPGNQIEFYIIANDGDFRGPNKNNILHPFLLREIQLIKPDMTVRVYQTINDFCSNKYKLLGESDDVHRHHLAEQLTECKSRRELSTIIGRIEMAIELFDEDHIDILFEAMIKNSNIAGNDNDPDICSFVEWIFARFERVRDNSHDLHKRFADFVYDQVNGKWYLFGKPSSLFPFGEIHNL